MKITLIMPRGALYRYQTGIFKRPILYAPLTLTTLAALIPEEIGAEVEIIDEGVERLPENINADLVGITAITGTAKRAYAIADTIRKKGIPVVLGGVHPTLMPQEASLHADSVVTGFAESTWPQLLHDFMRGEMKCLYAQPDGATLDHLPVPKRNLLKRKRYVTVNTFQATRGCSNLCDFCVAPVLTGHRMYFRPIPEVISELEQIEGKDILFVDVSPIENKTYATQLYRAMIPLKKRWLSPSTIKITEDKELFDAAVKSGCQGLLIGFESVSQVTLKQMGKGFNYVAKFKEQVRKLHENGIAIQACFVFGYDTDDKDIFAKTVDLVNQLKLDLPRYTVYTPFPGTPIFKKLQEENRIIEYNWSFYDAQHVVYTPALMAPEELQKGLFWAWEQSYRVSSVVTRLAGARCLLPHMIPANIAYRFYANNLPKYRKEMYAE